MTIPLEFDALKSSKIEAHIGQRCDFESSEGRRSCEFLIENGETLEMQAKSDIRKRAFEIQSSN
jgi:hypothetical protein